MLGSHTKTAIIAGTFGSAVAVIGCLGFFAYFSKGDRAANVAANTPVASATPTNNGGTLPPGPGDQPEIKPDEIRSLSIVTSYRGYFDAGTKCAKTYNEYFPDQKDFGSSNSACTITLTFERGGRAARSVEVFQWDKASGQRRVIEKTDATAVLTVGQFDAIAESIAANRAFREWQDGISINVSNCTITAQYDRGSRSPMSNVSPSATDYLPMVDAFRSLDKQLAWN